MIFFILLCLGLESAVAVRCRTGWVRYQESCFLFSHDAESWHTAELGCQFHAAALAEVTSEAENTFLVNEIKTRGHGPYWIGATDLEVEGVWRWIGSDKLVSYNHWGPGEPSNGNSEEHCALLYADNHWNDGTCRSEEYYICEMTDTTTETIG